MHLPYKFVVKQWSPSATPFTFSLVRDNWDDYGFKTLFVLHYTNGDGDQREIGAVKVGQFSLSDEDHVDLPRSFQRLEPKLFSVGQDREYYENLRALGSQLSDDILRSLNDIAFDAALLERAAEEEVTRVSLFRSIDRKTVEEQFHRIATGGQALARYKFSYSPPRFGGRAAPELSFDVYPNSMPPTNVHVHWQQRCWEDIATQRHAERVSPKPDFDASGWLVSRLELDNL